MLRTYFGTAEAKALQCGNTLIFALKKLPVIGRHIKDSQYTSGKKKTGFIIAGTVFDILFELMRKLAYVAAFVLLPRLVFSRIMAVGLSGFKLEDCYVYFTLVMTCICGSIIHSFIFNVNERSYIQLKVLRMNPRDYFRGGILVKLIREALTFWAAFTILGMNAFKALYLVIVIIIARFAGEIFNILFFRAFKKSFTQFTGAPVVLMLGSLFMAYFVPYVRGCVPAAYDLVFDTLWIVTMLVVASFFIYYVWNYDGYDMIAAKLYTRDAVDIHNREGEAVPATDAELNHMVVADKDIEVGENSGLTGYEYMNRLFFIRNRRTIINGIVIRVALILAALLVAVVATVMGNSGIVYKVISYSLPVLVFVMYLMSSGVRLCRTMFGHCDVSFLKNGYYRDRDAIITNFIIRLRYMTIIDIIPAGALAGAYVAAGVLADKKGSFTTVMCVCIGILLLSCFFSIYNLLMYYIFQPYNSNVEDKNPVYSVINILMYVGCYFCLGIETTSLWFILGVGLALAVMLAASVTLIVKLAPRTFRIK